MLNKRLKSAKAGGENEISMLHRNEIRPLALRALHPLTLSSSPFFCPLGLPSFFHARFLLALLSFLTLCPHYPSFCPSLALYL